MDNMDGDWLKVNACWNATDQVSVLGFHETMLYAATNSNSLRLKVKWRKVLKITFERLGQAYT